MWVVKYGRLAPEKSGMPLKPCWLMNSCVAAHQERSATWDTLALTPGMSGVQMEPRFVQSSAPTKLNWHGVRIYGPDEARLQAAAKGLHQGVAVQHDAGANL